MSDAGTQGHKTPLELAREQQALMREKGEFVVRDPIEHARDDPKSLRKAINAKCWDCVGADADGADVARENIREWTSAHFTTSARISGRGGHEDHENIGVHRHHQD